MFFMRNKNNNIRSSVKTSLEVFTQKMSQISKMIGCNILFNFIEVQEFDFSKSPQFSAIYFCFRRLLIDFFEFLLIYRFIILISFLT